MAKTLNPHATPAPPLSAQPPPPHPPRRNVLVATLAIVVGLLVGLFPVGSGALVFLDPILRRKKGAGDDKGKPKLRVASLEAIPPDGTPVQVPVIADLTDAWMRDPNQPVGAVYLRKNGDKVECLNAICPHAGCFVAYMADRKVFQCPCHTSAFGLDGKRLSEKSPSPRDMDTLNVDSDKLLNTGEVWVEYINYYPGKPTKEEKP